MVSDLGPAAGLPQGSCGEPNHRDSWSDTNNVPMGLMACFSDSTVRFVWTQEGENIEVYASSGQLDHTAMVGWWGSWAALAS